jgi:hypothetical protein
VLKSVALSDHITIGITLVLRICGTIMWCCHCNCVLFCLQTPGGSIITTCELIHYHYFWCCCFTRTLCVAGITCCNLYTNMSLLHYFPTLFFYTIYTHTNSNTEYTSSHSYRRIHCTLNHDIYIRYMASAAPPGKKFYKITVDLTDLKHEIQFLCSRNILILRITTRNLH